METGRVGHVVLVGLMGAGKTTTGRRLAARLGRPLIDNDAQVTAATGHTVAEITLRHGVAEMRRLEGAALLAALAAPEPSVITAAAGTVLDEGLRRRLRDGDVRVVWLRAEPAALAARVVLDPLRPLLGDDPEAVLRRQHEERAPLFAGIADVTVPVDHLTPDAIVARVVDAL